MLIEPEKIQKAKELLGDRNAALIADILNIQNYDEKNMKACCPFHEEKTPSFIYNRKSFCFHCFGSCGRNYDIIDAYIATGSTYVEAVQKLFELVDMPYSFGEKGVKTDHTYYYPTPEYDDNNDKVYDYLAKRGISRETVDRLGLRQDRHGDVLIQYYDTNDVLTMVKVRPAHKVEKGHTKIWALTDANKKAFSTSPILYNMNRVNTNSPLVITSGEFDCAAAIEAGWHNAVSIPMGDANTQWVEKCWDFLEQFQSIIIVPDNDESGAKYAKNIVPRLGSWRCKIAHVPTTVERPDGTTIRIKDLNEALVRLGREATLEILTHAEDSPVASVDDLSDVEDIDLDEMDGVPTGILGLDRELIRLFYGTLTIVSGTPGSGKTSFLYQLICEALDQDINTWLFSAELPESMTKNWFNYILAGRRNIDTFTTNNGDTYYKVKRDAKTAINDYYKGRWFVYKDDYDNNLDALIDSMTDVVRKYGVKFLILDNFMCIDSNDDKYKDELKAQTDMIKKLIAFSKKYAVATILVCHPRKMLPGMNVGIYDIAGTSNVINLAHRTIGLRRVKQEEKDNPEKMPKGKRWQVNYDVIATIIKDRMRGRSDKDVGIWYDVPSRRFYTNDDEFDRQYRWDTNVYDTALPPPPRDNDNEVFGEVKGTA